MSKLIRCLLNDGKPYAVVACSRALGGTKVREAQGLIFETMSGFWDSFAVK